VNLPRVLNPAPQPRKARINRFAAPDYPAYTFDMSFAEVKARIVKMTREERLEIAALLAHLNRSEDPHFMAELDRRMTAMDQGRKTSQAEVERIHKELTKQGK
jgi:hypothetical protein